MLNSLILLTYHAISSLRRTGISFIADDNLVYVYQNHENIAGRHNLQSAAERY